MIGDRNPIVSVVICTYNRASQLRAAVDSVLHQNISSGVILEILIVDDGSSDNTADVADAMRRDAPDVIRYLPVPHGG